MRGIMRLAVNSQGLQVHGAVLGQNWDIVTLVTVDIKTNSNSLCFAGELHVPVRSVELKIHSALESGTTSHTHDSIKHKTLDVKKYLLFSAIESVRPSCYRVHARWTGKCRGVQFELHVDVNVGVRWLVFPSNTSSLCCCCHTHPWSKRLINRRWKPEKLEVNSQ